MSKNSEALFGLFKDLVWDNIVEAALMDVMAAYAFLTWGPLALFVPWLVKKFSDAFYTKAKKFVDIERVVLTNESLKREFDLAAVKLKILADGGIDTPEFKEAREKAKLHLSKFVKFDSAR